MFENDISFLSKVAVWLTETEHLRPQLSGSRPHQRRLRCCNRLWLRCCSVSGCAAATISGCAAATICGCAAATVSGCAAAASLAARLQALTL